MPIAFFTYVLFWLRLVSSSEWHKTFAGQLQNEVRPYQLTVLSSELDDSSHLKGEFLQNIINDIPMVNINPLQMKDNRSLTMKVHQNPRAARALTVILQDTLNLSELQGYFSLIADLAPIEPRPKCLLVLSNNDTSQDDFETLFEHAWSLNFLELLILQLHGHGTPTCLDYNPFTNAINRWTYDSNVKLFPNKVRNIHNHPIKVPLADYYPLVKMAVDKISGKVTLSGFHYEYVKIFVEHVSGSVEYVDLKIKNNANIIQALNKGDIDVVTLYFMAGTFAYDKPVVKSRLFNSEKLVFIVPLLTVSKLNWPPHLQVNFASVIGLIICLKLASKLLKFSLADWTTSEITKLMFGVPTSSKLWRKTPERIVAILVMLLSMIFSSDMIASLTDIKLLKEELPLNTLNQINDSELPINVLEFYHPYFTDKFRNLKNQVQRVTNTSECFLANSRGQATVCVATELSASYYASSYPQAPMKVMDTPIFLDFNVFILGQASLYVEQFNDVLIRLTESGISKTLMWTVTRNKLQLHDKLFEDSSISVVLLIVLVSGFSLACLAFISEVVWHYCKA